MTDSAAQIRSYIEGLQLCSHPEGGYFKETFRSNGEIPQNALEPHGFKGARCFSTSIYFLLPGTTFSALHRILSDETWYFHAGAPLEVYMLFDDGTLKVEKIGPSFTNGESFQYTVPARCWFCSRSVDVDGFTLVGCQVAPGFDFQDFELAKRDELINTFPQHVDFINQFTR